MMMRLWYMAPQLFVKHNPKHIISITEIYDIPSAFSKEFIICVALYGPFALSCARCLHYTLGGTHHIMPNHKHCSMDCLLLLSHLLLPATHKTTNFNSPTHLNLNNRMNKLFRISMNLKGD